MLGILLILYFVTRLFDITFSEGIFWGRIPKNIQMRSKELRPLETVSCLMLCPVAIPFLSEPLAGDRIE